MSEHELDALNKKIDEICNLHRTLLITAVEYLVDQSTWQLVRPHILKTFGDRGIGASLKTEIKSELSHNKKAIL